MGLFEWSGIMRLTRLRVRVASAIVLLAVLTACNVETTPQPTGSPSAIAQDEEGRPAKKE
jgi:hypothetical protein